MGSKVSKSNKYNYKYELANDIDLSPRPLDPKIQEILDEIRSGEFKKKMRPDYFPPMVIERNCLSIRGKSCIEDGQTSVTIDLSYQGKFYYETTIHVTPIFNGNIRTLNASPIINGEFIVYGEPGEFCWMVTALIQEYSENPMSYTKRFIGYNPEHYKNF